MSVHYPKNSFLHFLDFEFQKRLESVKIPGMAHASWDRKAAYLLWLAEGNDGPIGNSQAAPPPPAPSKLRQRKLFEDDLI